MSGAARGGVHGLVGAMAMSGMRRLTTSLGLMRETPPETVVKTLASQALVRLQPGQQAAVIELAHWMYGIAGGAAFGLLPLAWRRRRLVGLGYGVVVWLAFEAAVEPVLGVRHPQGKVAGRLVLVADHAMYGLVLSGD